HQACHALAPGTVSPKVMDSSSWSIACLFLPNQRMGILRARQEKVNGRFQLCIAATNSGIKLQND
ncbi:hypothetical protein BZG17_30670, partial [Escherichia coli]|nr:hypothetical protein [Escherichia coli]